MVLKLEQSSDSFRVLVLDDVLVQSHVAFFGEVTYVFVEDSFRQFYFVRVVFLAGSADFLVYVRFSIWSHFLNFMTAFLGSFWTGYWQSLAGGQWVFETFVHI